jgi:hypothetical protein
MKTSALNLNTTYGNLALDTPAPMLIPESLSDLSLFSLPPEAVIQERSELTCSFNVMPGKPVSETFHIKEYRVWHNYAEATFDREYFSSMKKSPNHLIFLTGLTHTQKLIYVALAHQWNIPYSPEGTEQFKIWPTKVEVLMPSMVRKDNDVVQKLWINNIIEEKNGVFEIDITSTFNNIVTINATCRIFKI